jgi:molybdate transport system ATP-binding protein
MLLMDEPLAALDAARRDEILPYLSILRNEMRLPIVYASHSLDEVMRLADTLVLLEKGGVLACGPVSEIAARADLPLAARPDAGCVLHGYIASHNPDRGLSTIACGGQAVLVPMVDAPVGLNVRVRIPAREVILSLDLPRNISVNNVFAVTILTLGQAPERHAALVELDMGGGTLLAHLTQDAAKRLELRRGDSLYALIKSMSVELLPE